MEHETVELVTGICDGCGCSFDKVNTGKECCGCEDRNCVDCQVRHDCSDNDRDDND